MSEAKMIRTVGFALIVAACAGCGPDRDPAPIIPGGSGDNTNNGESNNQTTQSNNATTATNNGTTDADPACAGIVCENGRKCVKGVCVLEELKVACEDTVDLGMVSLAAPLTASGDTSSFADSTDLSCADGDGFSGAENAFLLTVPSAARVDVTLASSAGIDWVMELRTDSCTSDGTSCQDVEQLSFLAEPGRDYYVLVEPKMGIDEGAFDLTFEFTELLCSPPGGRSCDGEEVVVCQAGTSEARYTCGTGCSDGACSGDTCASAEIVTASASFAGDSDAYTNSLNFENQASCSGSGSQGLATPGPEIVLLLQGMLAQAVVTIDASMNDDNDNAIFVQEACGDEHACLVGNDVGDKLEFTVPTAGDYYVIIDKLTASSKPFFYSVDIQ